LEQGSFDQACQELAWCWEHALEVDPALAGVKYSYLLRDIKELMAEYAPARAVFVEIRDRTEQRLPESDALQDWLHLNQALGDEDRSLAWLDRSKADPAFSSLLEERRHVFTLFELLERHDRWADLGALIRDPTEFFRAEHKWLDEIRRQADLLENAEGIFAYIENNFRQHTGWLCRGLRAAGRVNEARSTAELATLLDGSAEMKAAVDGSESA
jgi:hypothetical protein